MKKENPSADSLDFAENNNSEGIDSLPPQAITRKDDEQVIVKKTVSELELERYKERNKKVFSVDKVEHEAIEKYHPRFLAKGGEHVVYDVEGHPDVVVKVNVYDLKNAIDGIVYQNTSNHEAANETTDETDATLSEEYQGTVFDLEGKMKTDIADCIKKQKRLAEYFGKKHVLSQRRVVVEIPLTEAIVKEIYHNRPPSVAIEKVRAIITVQRRVHEVADPEHLAVISGYAEYGDVPQKAYDKATWHLVFGKNPEQKLSQQELLKVQSMEDFKKLIKESEGDEGLREVLIDFVTRSIAYLKETGEILDLAGQDNVIFYREGTKGKDGKEKGKWTYRLIDALYTSPFKMIVETKKVLSTLFSEKNIGASGKNVLLNSFNCIRTINGLAEQLGIKERIFIDPKGAQEGSVDFLKVIKDS